MAANRCSRFRIDQLLHRDAGGPFNQDAKPSPNPYHAKGPAPLASLWDRKPLVGAGLDP